MKNNQIKVMFPGSFDPIHKGHIDVIKRASKLFAKVYVVVSVNIYKKSSDCVKRINTVKKAIQKLQLKNVEVVGNSGLSVDFAKKNGVSVILRGIRDKEDALYEINIAQVNHALNKNIETMLMLPRENLKKMSSTSIRYLQDVKKHKKGKK